MQYSIPASYIRPPYENQPAFSVKLKIGVMAVLAANVFLDTLFPNGVIPPASAAELEYQTEVQLVRSMTSHPIGMDSSWEIVVGDNMLSQSNHMSALDANQD